MKKQVANYISSIRGTSFYSGNSKTMYITDLKLPLFEKAISIQSIEEAVLNKFGFGLSFKLQTN